MPVGRDNNSGRPPRRKSWQDPYAAPNPDSAADDAYTDSSDPYYDGNGRARQPQPPDLKIETQRSRRLPRVTGDYTNRFGGDDDEESNDDSYSSGQKRPSLADGLRGSGGDSKARKKKKKKRLLSLVGNEVLCLVIIFSLIAVYNWMATDYSGDFMGRANKLGQVRLAIVRTDNGIDAELEYGRHGFMNMAPGSSTGAPKPDEPFTINFIETAGWGHGRAKPWLAVFVGKIDGGKAVGTITDTTGSYKVELEKNVLTSLFRQTQTHIPTAPAVPLPSLFDEKSKQNDAPRGVIPFKKN